MDRKSSSLQHLTDHDLIAEVARLAHREREATADLLHVLMEFDARRLYLREGYPSLFAYCTKVLNYSEHAALNRIEVARAARRFPALLDRVARGSVNLTGARILAPHMTDDNCDELLAAARQKSKREIEELIAALNPRPDAAPVIRKLPAPRAAPAVATDTQINECPKADLVSAPRSSAQPKSSTAPVAVVPVRPAITKMEPAVELLAPERYKVQFTITRETRDKLREVQDLMRHKLPDGDAAAIFDRALTLLLEHLQRQRFAATAKPRAAALADSRSRHIPACVQRAVWQRDGGRCAFVGSRGRCDERGFLEFHHVRPFAVDGPSTVDNIELRCRAHNQYEATLFFGSDFARELGIAWG